MFGRNKNNDADEQISDESLTENTPKQTEPTKELDPALKEKLVERSKHLEARLGKIVGLLMRSPNHKHYSLSDLEWLILPALVTNQISLAQAQKEENGLAIPVGLATWAQVSEEVDKKLSENLDKPIRLHPNEWRSGEIFWLIDVVGTPAVIQGLIEGLRRTSLKDKTFKMRIISKDGQRSIKSIEPGVQLNN